ncbi:MAG: hypothetical protein H8F28_08265 [Fibrella sp.]|nr:hypothetical protein [Armatimonadota bacterium]
MKHALTHLVAGAAGTVAALSLCVSAFAQTAPAAKPSVQLDGLEYRVIDRVWANTDHYFHEGDYNRIVALCRVCVESDPEFDEAYSCAAWILWSMGDKPAANTLMAYGTKRAKTKWKAEYTFAEQLMVRREYKDALPHLQNATKSPAAPVIAWKQLGHAYEKTGDLKNSLVTWQYILKRFPDEPSAPNNLKRVQGKLSGNPPAAKTGR